LQAHQRIRSPFSIGEVSSALIDRTDYEVLQVAPFKVNAVGLGLLVVQEPLKPRESEAPEAMEPL
jgi:hypothetical protein